MATCEELAATITTLQAALIVDTAAIEAAQNIKMAHELELWFAQYNYWLQGCDGGGSSSGSSYSMSTAGGMTVAPRGLMEIPGQSRRRMPERSATEMLIIMRIPDLYALHKRCEALLTT